MGTSQDQIAPAAASNLLVLSLDYPPNDGGISRLASALVMALRKQGSTLQVVTIKAGDTTGLPRPEVRHLEVAQRKGWRDWQLVQSVRAHLRRHGADAPILATVWNPEATLALLAGAQRVSILAHGNEVMPYPGPGPKALLRQAVLERAHAVICNSHFTETLVRQAAPRARTSVLNPAVDGSAFRPKVTRQQARTQLDLPAEPLIALTVARLDPIKGHETVLRALGQLPITERQQILYVIIGKGSMRGPLENLAHELRIREMVRFAGFVSDQDLPSWYAAADLFVLPSIVDRQRRGMEGFGMALTEAQAAGLPVIGSNSGGIPDAVREDEGGWLIQEGDAQALAARLMQMLADPDSLREQGRRGMERVTRDHNWPDYAKRLLELI